MNDWRESEPGRVGLMSSLTLSCYLRLIDAASRVGRDGKASLAVDAASIFARIGLDGSDWLEILEVLHRPRPASRLGRLHGRLAPSRRFPTLRFAAPPRPAIRAAMG